jgi:hypothetical protein
MFKWLQSRRRRPQPDLVAEPPSGMTRMKTDDI